MTASVDSGDRVIRQRGGNIDDASTCLLSQHLLDCQLSDEEKASDVDGNERLQILDCVIREWFREVNAGVVHGGVDRSEFTLGDLSDLRRRLALGDVPVNQREFI